MNFIAPLSISSYFYSDMIVCPVCRHSNDDFSITCSSCSSYIQDRVPNLDFFSMVWMIIEEPSAALRKVIIAEHKNFVLFLSLFLGVSAVFALMWAFKTGNAFDNLLPVLLAGVSAGLVAGIPLLLVFSIVLHLLARLFGGKAHVRDTYAVTGWSLVPVMLSAVFILPLELGILGLTLFSSNPSAYEVKPVVTAVLVGLDGLLVLWSILLCGRGVALAHRFKIITGMVVAVSAYAAVGVLSMTVYSYFIT